MNESRLKEAPQALQEKVAFVEPQAVPLEQTWLHEVALRYWELKGVFAFTDTGGEVNSGITNSFAHARSFKTVARAVGFAGTDLEAIAGNHQIIEYGAGTAYFADIFAWTDKTSKYPLFGKDSTWQWVVTDLQEAKVQAMRPVVTFTNRVKFAVIDAATPTELALLPDQELLDNPQNECMVANYLLGALPWQQVRRSAEGQIEIANYQTSIDVSKSEMTVEAFIKMYAVEDTSIMDLDWDAYANAIRLVPIYRAAQEEEITPEMEMALELSEGKETVVNDQALGFLRKALASLADDGIFFGNSYMADEAFYEELIKEHGFICPLLLGGSYAIGANFALIKKVLEQDGYFVYFEKSKLAKYGLFAITKKPSGAVESAIKESLEKEDAYLKEGMALQKKGNALIERTKTTVEDILEEEISGYLEEVQKNREAFGASYTLEIIAAYLSAEIGLLDDAIKHAENALQMSPHNEFAHELYITYRRKKMYRSLFV